MQKFIVERFQYGVGQGCFHGQEVSYEVNPGLPSLVLRFVYDCGSTGLKTALPWAIDHFTNNDEKFRIDALYISHFEFDHVNGIDLLSKQAEIDRIYIPHIDQKKAIHIIARACAEVQAAKGSATDKSKIGELTAILAEILGDGAMHHIPVIMVRPGNDPLPQQELVDSPTTEAISPVVSFPGITAQPRNSISNQDSAKIEVAKAGTISTVWEIVHWCYACDPDLTDAIASAIGGITDAETKFIRGLASNSTNKQRDVSIKWIKENFQKIASAYQTGISKHNVERLKKKLSAIPDDHNVTSLCVYSGPTFSPDGTGTYNSTRSNVQFCPCYLGYPSFPNNAASWLATGDAMLSLPDIWSEFEAHFTAARLTRCQTVLIPHHGSGKGKNFNPAFVRQHVNCVISAGAKNGFRHPGRSVVSSIMANEGHPILVSEAEQLGFVEHLQLPI